VLILKGASDAPQYFAIRDGRTLRKLDGEAREIASKASLDLRRTPAFQPIDVKLAMTGSYRSSAGAGLFVECSTGQSWPVSAGGDSQGLEAAYRSAKKRPGEPIIVAVDGHVAFTSNAEVDSTQPSLVVERLGKVTPAGTCPARFTPATLENTVWKLTRLGDQAVAQAGNPRQEPSLTFEADTGHFSGSGGCNRFIGTYHVSGTGMALTSAGTMKACPGAMTEEAAFSAAVRNTRSYRILGRQLDLYGEQGRLLARFEAKEPK
jgi:copper homeostasis protein (lipoprotein)